MHSGVEQIDALLTSKRILVLGPSGSGKTYLTLRLSEILGIRAIHLDACFYRPGWAATPQDEWLRVVQSMIQRPRWIMDGTYESTLQLRLPAADAIVVLELSRWASVWNVIRRKLVQRGPRPDAPPAQPIDRAFLRYIWQYPSHSRPRVQRLIELYARGTLRLDLFGRAQIECLLAAVESRRRGSL